MNITIISKESCLCMHINTKMYLEIGLRETFTFTLVQQWLVFRCMLSMIWWSNKNIKFKSFALQQLATNEDSVLCGEKASPYSSQWCSLSLKTVTLWFWSFFVQKSVLFVTFQHHLIFRQTYLHNYRKKYTCHIFM